MKRLFFYILSGLIFPCICQGQNLSDSVTTELGRIIEGFKDRYQSPAISVAIVHDKDIIFSQSLGYTDLERKTPADGNSKYPILSVTKTFTATMLMQLKERGIVSLDDDAIKYVPELEGSKTGTTSLLQLATHTAGLPRNTQADILFAEKADKWMATETGDSTLSMSSKEEFLQSLKFTETEYPKYQLRGYGDRRYSNMGYSILGIALERAAKDDFATYIINNICKPLGMNDTGFTDEPGIQRFLAKGYWYNDNLKSFTETPVFVPNSALYAGGMYSTATDLAKFICFQFTDNSTVLSDNHKAMMQTFNIAWKPSYPFVLHEGSMLGHRGFIAFNTELKIGWVILTNTTNFEFSKMHSMFNQLITPLYNKKAAFSINELAGAYELVGGYGNLEIYIKDGNLYSTYLQDIFPDCPLTPQGYNRFSVRGKSAYSIGYDFITDVSGKIVLNLGQLMWVKK
ncbi:MAG: beta-lactamase family protein [Prevotella sp.]|jgi:CubicO group peptidase (beta-lactamase class C family)|nr:beta-lactamase family protein [Prevotella sp.]